MNYKKNMLTDTKVIISDKEDLIAEICFKENSLSRDKTDNKAIPSPPLK